jgi:hypothetical protein
VCSEALLLFLINSIEVIAVHPKTIPNTILWVTGIGHSPMAEPIIAAAKRTAVKFARFLIPIFSLEL